MAMLEMNPRRIRSMRTGPRPTLITWPPMPHRTALRDLRAFWIAERSSRRFSAARIRGNESKNFARPALLEVGLAKSLLLTLLLREARGYMRKPASVIGRVE